MYVFTHYSVYVCCSDFPLLHYMHVRIAWHTFVVLYSAADHSVNNECMNEVQLCTQTITARHQYGTPSFLLTIALHWDLRSEIWDLSLRIARAWMEHTMTVYMTWGMWLSPQHTTKLVTEIWLYACMWTSPCIDMLILYLACNLQWLLNISYLWFLTHIYIYIYVHT